MAITKDHRDVHRLLTTDAGAVDAWVQNGDTVYVRGGLNETGTFPQAAEPLDLGRGVLVTVRAHFKRVNGSWTCKQPFVYRVDQGRHKDVTGAQVRRAVNAITPALAELAGSPDGRALLQMAALEAAQAVAAERTALALQLRQIADHLDTEAHELLSGGRWTYRTGHISSGSNVRFGQVLTRDGALLAPVKLPPRVSGALDCPLEYVKDNHEEQ